MSMEKMIKAFDMLIADSEKKGISIYQNQGFAHFILQCGEELQNNEAFDILEEHIKENENVFLTRMKDDEKTELSIDMAILKLRHFIYKNRGEDALSRIQVIQTTKPTPKV